MTIFEERVLWVQAETPQHAVRVTEAVLGEFHSEIVPAAVTPFARVCPVRLNGTPKGSHRA